MVRNRATNDEDFVQPTKYPKLLCGVARNPLPKPSLLPDFKPLFIDNENTYSKPNLLYNINLNDPYQIFKLFWIDELLNKLVEYINWNIELYPPSKEVLNKHLCPWKLISRLELHAYLAVLIYIGLYIEPSIKDY